MIAGRSVYGRAVGAGRTMVGLLALVLPRIRLCRVAGGGGVGGGGGGGGASGGGERR